MLLEDYKRQIFNEIPQEYPLKYLRCNSRPRTGRETPQQIFPDSSEELNAWKFASSLRSSLPRLCVQALMCFAGEMRICRRVHGLSLWAGRSGHQGKFAPLKVHQEYFYNTKQIFPAISNPNYFYLFSQDLYFFSVCCQSHIETPKQNRRGSFPYISSSTRVMTRNQPTSEQAVMKLPAWLCSLSLFTSAATLQGPHLTCNS